MRRQALNIGTDGVHVDRFRVRHLQSAGKCPPRVRHMKGLQRWLDPRSPATQSAGRIRQYRYRFRSFFNCHHPQQLRYGKYFPRGNARSLGYVGLIRVHLSPFVYTFHPVGAHSIFECGARLALRQGALSQPMTACAVKTIPQSNVNSPLDGNCHPSRVGFSLTARHQFPGGYRFSIRSGAQPDGHSDLPCQ